MPKSKVDERVTKRCVTMRSVQAVPGGTAVHEVKDYVLPEHLEAYVADARTKWQVVEVSEQPDAGPGGYEGQTAVPAHLSVPDAGTVRPAEES